MPGIAPEASAFAFLGALLFYSNALSRGRPAPWLRRPFSPYLLVLICLVSAYFSGFFSSPFLGLLSLCVLAIYRFDSFQAALGASLLASLVTATLAFREADPKPWVDLLWPWSGLLVGYFLGRPLASRDEGHSKSEAIVKKGSTPETLPLRSRAIDGTSFVEAAFAAALDMGFQSQAHWNVLLLLELKEGKLELRRAYCRDGKLKAELQIEPGEGLLGWALRERKRFINSELGESTSSALPYYEAPTKVSGIMALPLLNEGELDGFLAVDRKDGLPWSAEEESALEALTRQLVLLRQLAAQYGRVQSHGQKVSELYEVSKQLSESLEREQLIGRLGGLLGRLLSYDSFYLALREGEEEEFRLAASLGYQKDYMSTYRLGEDTELGGWVLREGEPMAFNAGFAELSTPPFLKAGLEAEAKSFLLVPLMRQRRVAGLLKLDRREGGKGFDAEDKEIALIFGSLASQTLEHARLYSLHKRMATTDGLTGLYNHRYFQERLALELDIARRSGRPLALALTDIDFFKKFNDTFGHQEGDQVLRKVAVLLQQAVRENQDIVCRYGGEEFVIVMPDCDLVQAREILERLRHACETTLIGGSGAQARPITLSVGLSSFPQAAEQQRELIHKADEALYKAKQTGRNRICSFKDLP